MQHWLIAIGFNASSQPCDRFVFGSYLRLDEPDKRHPPENEGIARREAERLLYVSLGLRAATHKILGETDPTVCNGQVPVQRQSLLVLSNKAKSSEQHECDP